MIEISDLLYFFICNLYNKSLIYIFFSFEKISNILLARSFYRLVWQDCLRMGDRNLRLCHGNLAEYRRGSIAEGIRSVNALKATIFHSSLKGGWRRHTEYVAKSVKCLELNNDAFVARRIHICRASKSFNAKLRNDHLSSRRTLSARSTVFALRRSCSLILSYWYNLAPVRHSVGCQKDTRVGDRII